MGIRQVNENEIRLKWHPFPEEKPKKKRNCIISVTYFEKEFILLSPAILGRTAKKPNLFIIMKRKKSINLNPACLHRFTG